MYISIHIKVDKCCRYIICVHTVQIYGIYVRKVQQQRGTSAALRQARQKNVELERLVRIHIYIWICRCTMHINCFI